ncbi:Rpn family recombination-promoting nuclease/putative transposase [Rickettsiella endosymbiont of Xylota segnis]|uniref:Rpn family recombination-promoting nuclease/putative transposase n=1 Tax=Rickettsiella endosymbiont of Xylota segnis TaxID=3066238 RepID=UPI0030D51096
MKTTIHQPHDKFFKRNLKDKRVAIDFLKSYLAPQLYNKIDINSLQLTEKSFIVPQLREIHSDVIYKCLINKVPGYLFFLLEHQSTDDPLMAFRFLHAIVSLSYEHLKQGHAKLPIILPFCMYHGDKSPYPYSTCLYDCFEQPDFAKEIAFKPFKLIDLTILSDEEIKSHGLVGLMEMLFKHQRDKNFLSIMRRLLESQFVQNIIKQLNISYLTDMLNYIVNTSQDDSEPKAAQHLIEELIKAFPEEPARKTIMTFAQQLKEEYKQEFMGTLAQQLKQEGLQQGLQQGRQEVLALVRNLLKQNVPLATIKSASGLSEQELLELEDV